MYKRISIVLALATGLWLFSSVPASAASTDNFTILDYKVDMQLARDTDERATLKVTETIVAEFPNFDQNHGLERIFVKTYDGHQTNFQLQSVTNTAGAAQPYHWEGDALRIGSADSYVHGVQTYVISYTQRDVTKFYKDTKKDEFYWDVIGVEWRVPIQQTSIRLSVDSSLVGAVSTDMSCYAGDTGKTNHECKVSKTESGSDVVYIVSTKDLRPRQGVTVSLGFKPRTFAKYAYTPLERLQQWQNLVAIPAAVAGVVISLISLVIFLVYTRTSKKRLGPIAPEYLPPKDTSITVAGRIVGAQYRAGPAQMIDFAVRHYVKLYETKEKSLFVPAEYEIEVIKSINDLSEEEREILIDMFGHKPNVGEKLNLKSLRNNTSYAVRVQDNVSKLTKLMRGTYGLREKHTGLRKWLYITAIVVTVLSILTLSIFLAGAIGWLLLLAVTSYRSTDKGVALERYLKGLKMYIKVGEAERLKYLQSPEGAEKVHEVVDGVDTPKQRIVLYEKVLPYAVLFGQEKEWSKQLASLYDQASEQPGWYNSHSGVWSAAAFSSSMGSFSVSTASAASSSTGGSSGGGSSGGGGGGGGGGGW